MRRLVHRRGRRLAVRLAALALATAACGGPTVPLEIGMKEADLDVTYGRQGQPQQPPARAPGSSIGPSTAPGFVAAPVAIAKVADLPEPVGESAPPKVTTPRPTPPPPARCPEGDLYDPAVPDAPAAVTKPPTPGVYRYRRDGWLKAETLANDPTFTKMASWPTEVLAPEITREVKDVTSTPTPNRPPTIRYSVVQSETSATGEVFTTTTKYLVEPGTGTTAVEEDAGGLYIEQIVTQRSTAAPDGPGGTAVVNDGVETFSPAPPIKLMDLPARPQLFTPDRASRGVDPLTGAQMTIVRQTARRERFDACGDVLDVWRTNIYLASEYNNNGVQYVKRFRISGFLYVAPQLGGLIVQDNLLFGLDGNNAAAAVIPGRDGPRWFVQHSDARLSTVRPEAAR